MFKVARIPLRRSAVLINSRLKTTGGNSAYKTDVKPMKISAPGMAPRTGGAASKDEGSLLSTPQIIAAMGAFCVSSFTAIAFVMETNPELAEKIENVSPEYSKMIFDPIRKGVRTIINPEQVKASIDEKKQAEAPASLMPPVVEEESVATVQTEDTEVVSNVIDNDEQNSSAEEKVSDDAFLANELDEFISPSDDGAAKESAAVVAVDSVPAEEIFTGSVIDEDVPAPAVGEAEVTTMTEVLPAPAPAPVVIDVLPEVPAENASHPHAAIPPAPSSSFPVPATLTSQALEGFTEEELRSKLAQLTAEFMERTQWEGVRMHATIKQVEQDMESKYELLLQQQREQLQAELDKLVLRRELDLNERAALERQEVATQYQASTENALKAQAEGFNNSLQKELATQADTITSQLQGELTNQVAVLRQNHVKELVAFQSVLDKVAAGLNAYDSAAAQIKDNFHSGNALHRQAAVILVIDKLLERSDPLGKDKLNMLKIACEENVLLSSAVNALPESIATDGVATIAELRSRFKIVRKEVRKASLIPEVVPKFLGQAVGQVLASVSWVPEGNVKGLSLEETLSRMAYHLDHGKLDAVLGELNSLDSMAGSDPQQEHTNAYVKLVMNDWHEETKKRYMVDQISSVLRCEAALVHGSQV